MKRPATHYAENMRRLRSRGWTLTRIGRRYGVSKQRVAQIIGEREAVTQARGPWFCACGAEGPCANPRCHVRTAVLPSGVCAACGNVRGIANPSRFACSDCWEALGQASAS